MEKISRRTYAIITVLILLIISATFAICMIDFEKDNRTYDEKVAAFAAENSSFDKGQTVFVGDSITAKYKLDYFYRDTNIQMYNRGISGDTSDWLLTRMQVSVLDIAPARIVLMIGTNDINEGKTSEEIAKNYDEILGLISHNLPDTEVYCISIIPQNTDHSDKAYENNQRIISANEKIESLAISYGYKYLNLYDRLATATGVLHKIYSTDGLHLSMKGYEVWTEAMKERFGF